MHGQSGKASDDATLRMGEPSAELDAELTRGDFAGFRILRQIGTGGMGQVFLAEQSVPMLRRVALKLMRAAVLTPELAARFAIEQQALARLEHPAIARLYEAGTTQGGFPWFAMELVDGAPLTNYADAAQLSIEQRVRLLLAICEGVRHAHRRGILHRDLKPGNILVAQVDGVAHPKIIDFGIARALDQPAGSDSLTGAEIIGTPAYLAPEALAAAAGGDLDTRVDVYALGVILYELLAGARPHDLSGSSILQIMREVSEHDAPPPRRRYLAASSAEQMQIASARGLTPAALARTLGGELGWIAEHAVARQRDERYGSVEALSADLERWLANEPVSVAPPSAWYRLRKLLVRRRGPALALAAVFVALLAGVIAFSVAAARADREAAAARLARAEAEQVSALMTGLFEQADPSRSRGGTLTVREVLDSGAERVRLQLADQPQLRGAFLRTLAGVYESLGLLPQAQPLADESLALAASPHERALSLFTLGRLRNAQGQYAKASELMQSALALVDTGNAELSPDALADLLNRYGISERLQRHMDTSEQLHMRELVVRLGAHAAADSVTGRAYYALAYVRYMRNDFLSAELLLRRTIEIYQRRFGDDYSGLAGPTRTLADLLDEQGRHADAEPLYLRSLAITESVYGPDHPNVALQANNLGVSYYLQDRLDEALPYFERSLAINRKRLPADHPELGNPQLNMGLVYLKQHKYAEAEARFRATLALWEGRVPADDPNLAWVWWGLGETYLQTGKPAQAEPWLARAYAQRVATQSPDHRDLLQAKASLEAARAALSTPAPAPH